MGVGGTTNYYAYADHDPISITNPLGLWGVFGFGSLTGATPGPVRGALEGIALARYDSHSGVTRATLAPQEWQSGHKTMALTL